VSAPSLRGRAPVGAATRKPPATRLNGTAGIGTSTQARPTHVGTEDAASVVEHGEKRSAARPLERTGGIRALSSTAQQAPQICPTGQLELGPAARLRALPGRQGNGRADPACWFELGLTLDRFCDAADRYYSIAMHLHLCAQGGPFGLNIWCRRVSCRRTGPIDRQRCRLRLGLKVTRSRLPMTAVTSAKPMPAAKFADRVASGALMIALPARHRRQ
jgi:hypothetical protein